MAGTNIAFITEIRLEPTNKFTLIKKNKNHENKIDLKNSKDILKLKLSNCIVIL